MEQNAHTPVPAQDHFRHLLAEFGGTLFKDIPTLRTNPVALYLAGQAMYSRREAVTRMKNVVEVVTGAPGNPLG